jgi:microcystin-dependent protein
MISKSLIIDLQQPFKDPIKVVQYEVDSRTLAIQLTNGGVAVDLTGCSVNFYIKRPSITEPIYDACIITNATSGEFEFTFSEQACIESGDLTCWITIDKTGAHLRTFNFTATVNASPDIAGAAEATSEFTALTVALSTTASLQGQIDNIWDHFPLGMILDYPADEAPSSKYLEANGQAISRTTYAAWFTKYGIRFGAGNGSTTVNVPDRRGRKPAGYDPAQTEFNAVGKHGGEKTHLLTIAEMPAHTHDTNIFVGGTGDPHYSSPIGASTQPIGTSSVGGDTAHNNIDPYEVTRFWVKVLP